MTKKILMVVLDGLSGYPGESALKKAKKPALNQLVKKSKAGIMETVPGVAPESDSAVLSLLGYDPFKYYTGRGPLEAAGVGIKIKDGELSIRCNFATTSDGKKIIDRRVARSLTSAESKMLERVINAKVKLKDAEFVFKATSQHRGVLIIKSKKQLSPEVSNTDPAYKRGKNGVSVALPKFKMEVQKAKPLKKTKAAEFTARLINDFTKQAYEVLNNTTVNRRRKASKLLPANLILCRDYGTKVPKLFDISKKYGMKWAVLADMPLERGIATLAGMDVIQLSEPTFGKKDYKERLRKVFRALQTYDALYIHIKGPDLFGHDGDFSGKKKSIEDIDANFIKPLVEKLDFKNVVLAVTADHSTPCQLKAHSSDPVPLLIYTEGIKADKVTSYDVESLKQGSLKLKGKQLVPKLVKIARGK